MSFYIYFKGLPLIIPLIISPINVNSSVILSWMWIKKNNNKKKLFVLIFCKDNFFYKIFSFKQTNALITKITLLNHNLKAVSLKCVLCYYVNQ